MEIYIVRHGDASEGDIDELRGLSEKGKKQAKKAGKILKNLNVKMDEIFSSPLTRAIQTAEIIAKETDFKNEIKITELLNPLSNPDEILNHLNYLNKDKILIVGHQPFLGKMLAFQTRLKYTNEVSVKFIKSNEECVDLKKGCLCKVEIKNGKFKKAEQII